MKLIILILMYIGCYKFNDGDITGPLFLTLLLMGDTISKCRAKFRNKKGGTR